MSFASLSVRPGLYVIFEEFIVHLPATDLRPVLKSLLLSLLPALEDDTGEDFERALRIVESLEGAFSPIGRADEQTTEKDGYFWQCLFLAVMTSPARRQGSLNILVRRLPKFTPAGHESGLTPTAHRILSPEPGLLIRCFASGLSDQQILVQRGFLDLLVTHIPLDSPVIQSKVRVEDVDLLVTAAVRVLLRREMSLNRRLWSWFLGPDTTADANGGKTTSVPSQGKRSIESNADRQLQYFTTYGKAHLVRCIHALFRRTSLDPTERARPFRICLSLMDRWEIGGSVVPDIFLPAMQNVHQYSLQASASDSSDVLRSASLFFDGVESMLIWTNLIKLITSQDEENDGDEDLKILPWIIQHFNVKDEEMVTIHIPYAAILTQSIMLTTDLSEPRMTTNMDNLSILLNLIPESAFSSSDRKLGEIGVDYRDSPPAELQGQIGKFYQTKSSSSSGVPPVGTQSTTSILWRFTELLAIKYLEAGSSDCFSKSTALILALGSKLSTLPEEWTAELLHELSTAVNSLRLDLAMPFPVVSSLVSLLTWLWTKVQPEDTPTKSLTAALQRTLNAQLWRYLSPDSPKYNVEAVKAIWQLQDHAPSADMTEVALTALVRHADAVTESQMVDHVGSVRRFMALWNHTVSSSADARKLPLTAARRASTMSTTLSDNKACVERQRTLTTPLLVVLDTLNDPTGPAYDAVSNWVRTTSSLEHILEIQFEFLVASASVKSDLAGRSHIEGRRLSGDKVRDLEYALNHFLGIIRCNDAWIWQCLENMTISEIDEESSRSGLVILASYCGSFITDETYVSVSLKRKSIAVLLALLTSPSAAELELLNLESRLLDYLTRLVVAGPHELQGPLLILITRALSLRLPVNGTARVHYARPRGSISLERPSQSGMPMNSPSSSSSVVAAPPLQLLDCLKLGFSSQSSRAYLDQWLLFLSDILPLFADSIFANLLPLVECFCKELDKIQHDLVALSTTTGSSVSAVPESAAMVLLEALEIVLSRAHERLVTDSNAEHELKPISQSRGLLGNVTAGVFKTEGPPARNAQANSRLTVTLALQDAVRVTVDIWVWCSRHTESENYDRTSSATTTYNALKLRSRTRRLLERFFGVEPLEALEVVISMWCHSTVSGHAHATLDMLHAIQGLRPKNIIPATLDALCSRTNPTILSAVRLSTQTMELTAVDVAAFLEAYLKSVEDDAMDEIWPDCTAFLRDVLSNPLPYRQVLPALLSIILLLAQKVDNTNFGEQRKMRRDLGDIFTRLLTATLTTMPLSHAEDDTLHGSNEHDGGVTNSYLARRDLGLISVLRSIVANIEVILEGQDRTMTTTTSITTSLISPLLHSKAFPGNLTANSLALLLQITKKSPQARSWRKELSDAYNDPRLLTSPVAIMEECWFPVLHQWTIHDKERMPELISRLVAPSSAGIMFGVGASAARLEADRKAQLNLRRICILLLAAPKDTFVSQLRDMWEKLVELFDANLSSSPSAAVKAELFMLCRTLTLSTSSIHLAPLWPVINDNLQAAFTSLSPGVSTGATFGNLALLQACKLLDLLVALSPDEFQLHEWLYITDTTDAVYQPPDWTPSSLSDQIAEHLDVDGLQESTRELAPAPVASTTSTSGRRRPLIDDPSSADKGDYEAMAREDFARIVLRPFLSQLSIHSYEGVYSMDTPDSATWRRILLEDILDLSTIVE